jgi:hypothetical protein
MTDFGSFSRNNYFHVITPVITFCFVLLVFQSAYYCVKKRTFSVVDILNKSLIIGTLSYPLFLLVLLVTASGLTTLASWVGSIVGAFLLSTPIFLIMIPLSLIYFKHRLSKINHLFTVVNLVGVVVSIYFEIFIMHSVESGS